MLAIAANSLEASPSDLEIEHGSVFVKGTPTKALTMREIANAA